MLKVPEHQTYTLLTIDPGLNNTGLAFFKIDPDQPAILSIDTELLSAQRLVDDSGFDQEDHFERLVKRSAQARALKRILEHLDPCIVVCESPFFNAKRPSSFAILTEVVTHLFDTVAMHNPLCRFHWHAPQHVKKAIGCAGIKGKEIIQESLQKIDQITSVLVKPLDEISEHERDAIAVGFSYLVQQYPEWKR